MVKLSGLISQDLEWSLLLIACRDAVKGSSELDNFELHNINWQKLQKLIQIHRVAPLVFYQLRLKNRLDEVPDLFRQWLTSKSQLIGFQNLAQKGEMLKLIKQFNEHNIEVIPYKGVILAEQAYNNVVLRESSDIDLLIDIKDLEKIGSILEVNNYNACSKIPKWIYPFFQKWYCEYNFDKVAGGHRLFHVEPHWALGNKKYQTFIPTHEFMSIAKKEKLNGIDINLLSPEGLLITTALHHGGTDNWLHLKAIADIASIVHRNQNNIDWEIIETFCHRHRVTNLVVSGLAIVSNLMDIKIEDEAILGRINSTKISRLTKNRIRALKKTDIVKSTSNKFLNRIWYQMQLREFPVTKWNILRYHIIHLFMRNFIYRKNPL